jgi:ribosome-associated protein
MELSGGRGYISVVRMGACGCAARRGSASRAIAKKGSTLDTSMPREAAGASHPAPAHLAAQGGTMTGHADQASRAAGDPLGLVLTVLDDSKAEDTVVIDLKGKTSLADTMIVTSGRSNRHVGAIADHVLETLRDNGHKNLRVEGQPHCDWVLIDAGDVIVHVFRPEVRHFYNLEKIWGGDRPVEARG